MRILPSNLSSPQGGGRAVAYDALPAGLIGGIEIIESLRPEDDAEGLGGAVNLIPRRPLSNGQPFVNVTAGLGLETLRDTQVLDYGINGGFSFGLGHGDGPFSHPAKGSGFFSNARPFSVFFTDTQHNDYRGVDDFEPAYSDNQASGAPDKLLSGVDFRHYLYNRRRFSRSGEADFDPNDNDHYYFRYAEAGYNEHAEKDFLRFNNLDSGFTGGTGFIDLSDPSGRSFYSPATQVERTNTDSEEEVRNRIISWGGRDVLFDVVKLDYFGAYSEGTDNVPSSFGSTFADPNPVALSYNNVINSSHLYYHTTDGTNLLDPATYQLVNESNQISSSRDQEFSGAINATIPFHLITPTDQIKTGAILRLRDRVMNNSNGVSCGSDSGIACQSAASSLADYVQGSPLTFYNGYYDIGPSINAHSVAALLGNQPQPTYDPTQFQHDSENVYAGYGEYSGTLGKLSWLTGVRLEQTFGVYRGFASVTDAEGNTTNPASSFKHAYVDYFPSAQFKYAITPDIDARAIYSTALARPGFNEISPATTVSLASDSVNIGNPSLGATYGNNFDVALEYFLPNGGKVSLAGFDKEFTGYILPRETIGAFNNPLFAGNDHVVVNTYSTSGHSRVYGTEAEFTQQFLFLPAPFDGFGVDSNLTYNQSEVRFLRPQANGLMGTETLQLPSTSPWNFNAALFYEKGAITARLAASYVSKNLFTLGGTKATDIYTQQRFRLDLGTAYQVTKSVQIYLDAHNLTDTTLKFTETASVSRPIQREFYGPDIIGGIRAGF